MLGGCCWRSGYVVKELGGVACVVDGWVLWGVVLVCLRLDINKFVDYLVWGYCNFPEAALKIFLDS